MAEKRHLWSTVLALATFDMLADLIISHFLSTSPIMPNLGSLCHPHGLEEAPVAHQPDPGQLQRIWLKFKLCTATYDPNIP